MIIYLYEYLFYRSYDFISSTGKNNVPFIASHLLTSQISLLLLVISLFFTDERNVMTLGYVFVGVALLFYLLNYYLFLKDEKYLVVLKKYENESSRQKKWGRIGVVLTLVFIFFLMFVE